MTQQFSITLAPMEGVIDHLMRHILSGLGGIDLCVTEFIRIVDQKLPDRVFFRYCQELHHGGRTPNGTPVRIQLLGQEPNWLAENAVVATELGSHGVDLNFGCPAKTVNKNRGGAVLLKDPETLYRIGKAVRDAVPDNQPVTAKMRLGFENDDLSLENAQALEAAGVNAIAIHARTKTQGYKPPAYWHKIQEIKSHISTPIIANGEIWTPAQAQQCQLESACNAIMLGRGALARPNLGAWIKGLAEPLTWCEVLALLMQYSEYEIEGDKGLYYSNRVKQWLVYIKLAYPEAHEFFRKIRTIRTTDGMYNAIKMEHNQNLEIA